MTGEELGADVPTGPAHRDPEPRADSRDAVDRCCAGHTRITTQALTSIARAAAADALGVAPARVRASYTDDGGLLALLLALPLPVPALRRVVEDPAVVESFGGTLWSRADAARGPILDRVQHLTGAQLSRVDIRVIGSTVTRGARVL